LVEVAPPFDPTGNTALTGATLMFEILCVVAQSLSRRKWQCLSKKIPSSLETDPH